MCAGAAAVGGKMSAAAPLEVLATARLPSPLQYLLYVYVPQWLATSIFCLNQELLPAQWQAQAQGSGHQPAHSHTQPPALTRE